MAHYIVSSGVTSENKTLYSSDSMTILNGGVTWDIILRNKNQEEDSSGCFVDISSGGVANLTSIGGGSMFVYSGGLSYYTYFFSEGGVFYVFSGGTAIGTYLQPKVSMFVSSGATATSTSINAGASMFIYEGGIANETRVLSNAVLTVSSSVVINDAILWGGELVVLSGGVANNTTINLIYEGSPSSAILKPGGGINVSSGGIVNSTTMNCGSINVFSGGFVNNTTMNWGSLTVYSRGVVSHIDIERAASMTVYSRGTATEIIENGGYVDVEEGAKVSFLPNTFSGLSLTNNSVTIHSGTTANDTRLSGGTMLIYSGGTAKSTYGAGYMWVYSGGVVEDTNLWKSMAIFSGGFANSTCINLGASLTIYTGGVASNIGAFGGNLYISSGGTANNITNNCYIEVYSGGTANDVTVSGRLTVHFGGIANNIIAQDHGSVTISGGGVANQTTLNNAKLIVSSGGRMKDTTINDGSYSFSSGVTISNTILNKGHIYIGGGAANQTVINSGGTFYGKGVISKVTVNDGGTLFVYSGGTATEIIENGGYVDDEKANMTFASNVFSNLSLYKSASVHSGTTAISNTVFKDAVLTVFSGGTANNTTVDDGNIKVLACGLINETTVKNNGVLFVSSGGVVKNTTIDYEGNLRLSSGAIASFTTVNNEGSLLIDYGGSALEIIENGGYVEVAEGANVTFASHAFSGLILSDYVSATIHSGTTANSATVEEDGKLFVYSGGKITGQMLFEDGSIVSAYEGAVLNFDISSLKPNETPLISNLSLIQGTPLYTLTISDQQKSGIYVLASSAASFNSSVAVQNSTGELMEDLCLGEVFVLGETSYTLNLNESVLSLTVSSPDGNAPMVSNVMANIMSPTNQNVTVTAIFEDDVEIASKLYKIGDETWQNYEDGGVNVTENDTVFFKAVDTSGNESEVVSYVVTNIDKVAPTITGITPSTTEPDVTSVTVTATFTDDVALDMKQCKLGDGDWIDYEDDGITVTENTIVFFRAVDTAGNETTDSYTVTNIKTVIPDTTKPTVSNVMASTQDPTNQDVRVTADFSDDVELAQSLYKIESTGSWTAYPEDGIIVENNATFYFKAVDAAGNESEVVCYAVTNIDKEFPTITISQDTTAPVESVNLTATFTDNLKLALQQYRIGDGEWTDYTSDVTVTENTTVSFRAVDTAGNETEESRSVTNIKVVVADTSDPVVSNLMASTNTPTNQNVTVTAEFTDNVAVASKLYKLGTDGAWTNYPDLGVTVEQNTTVYFKSVDTAGNESEVVSITIDNIDKEPPAKPTASADITTNTSGNVNVTATFSEDSIAKEFSFDNQTWSAYAGTVPFTKNGIVYFRSMDAAGNISETTSYIVSNISGGEEGVTSSGLVLSSGQSITAYSGDEYQNTVVENNGKVYVSSGGIVRNTTVFDPGLLCIYSGGIAFDTIVTDGRYTSWNEHGVRVSSGGVVSNITIESDGLLIVSSGGKLTGKLVRLGGRTVDIQSGAVVNFDLIDAKPGIVAQMYFNFSSASSVYTMTIAETQAEGIYTLVDGTDSFNNTITVVNKEGEELGTLSIGKTETISGTPYKLVFSDRTLTLEVGSAPSYELSNVDGLVIISGRTNTVYSGNVFHNTLIHSGGSLIVSYGGVASNTSVTPRGRFTISSGGTATGTTVDFNAGIYLLPGATANNTTVNSSGTMIISSGGTANSTIINSGAHLTISNGGVISNTTINSGGSLNAVFGSNAATTDTVIKSGGTMSIARGMVSNTTVENSGCFNVFSSLVRNVSVNSGGTMCVSSGGSVTGQMDFEDGAVVSIDNGVTISFDITEQEPGSTALANNLSLVQGSPDFALNVVATQKVGTYKLAEGVGNSFDHTIRVLCLRFDEGSWGVVRVLEKAGELTVGNTISIKNQEYTLNLTNSVLFLTVQGDDLIAPTVSNIKADITIPTNQNITITADFADDVQLTQSLYKIGDNGAWTAYPESGVIVTENATILFKAVDAAGNESEVVSYTVNNIDKDAPVITLSDTPQTLAEQVMLTATVDDGSAIFYRIKDSGEWTEYTGTIIVSANATYSFKATDAAGNTGTAEIVFDNIRPMGVVPDNLVGTPDKVSWEAATTDEKQLFVVEYSTDNFEHVIQVVTSASATDLLDLPAGTYQWRVRAENSEEWAVGEAFVSEAESDAPKVVQSNEDGNDDLFFASTNGTWENIYYAHHVGSIGDWDGTNDWASAAGKGRIQNLFFGSSDPNVLCLSDGENGDAIFVDDVYTDSPEDVAKNTARLFKIQEIRAGAGNDIVDMTSQRFEYTGDGLTIRGGEGNDTIWANKGNNWLFGDAGNDRIIGASGDDVIVGGIGNDSMHGGGGNDVFTFCDNWGVDTVEQLASGSVTLWFAEGSKDNWDETTLTYTDGDNCIKVSGVTADKVTLKFGDDSSAQFASLTSMGAFFDATTERIFEESGKGILASL